MGGGAYHKFLILTLVILANCFAEDSSDNPYLIKDTHLLINPIFDEFQLSTQNSIRLEFASSLSPKRRYFNTNLIYAQPNRIFKLPGRINFEIGGVFSSPNQKISYNFAMVGISQDLVLPIYPSEFGNLFLGVGIGLYIKSEIDDRVGSKVTFGERFFLGYVFKGFEIEIYYKHYSNGTLENPNSGHDFGGLSLGYCF